MKERGGWEETRRTSRALLGNQANILETTLSRETWLLVDLTVLETGGSVCQARAGLWQGRAGHWSSREKDSWLLVRLEEGPEQLLCLWESEPLGISHTRMALAGDAQKLAKFTVGLPQPGQPLREACLS